ncbi:hypothetical protein BSPLISOX_3174 [uncultured Gammaproteobacteria bacterium]|nr:hypothetical protein [uncultured Gammaproteobacteria bacterium]CAC9457206.1 hypothetical protein [uncultured Gammaproteobacteria bacterium]CAC9465106.1 hypothetical protein [uncultured Gammaproteobacteria bacterium]VVH64145.1 hypothetical protein BSPLISOX_3174 [uncultured Gammaproteobacteria bacterium]
MSITAQLGIRHINETVCKGLFLGGFNSHIYSKLLINITYYYNHGVCVGFLALSGFK